MTKNNFDFFIELIKGGTRLNEVRDGYKVSLYDSSLSMVGCLLSVYLSPELKAGAVAGMLWGLYLMFELNYELALSNVFAKIYAGHLGILPYFWLAFALVGVIMGGVMGFVIGVIFVKIRDYIPGHSIFVKAILLWVALWVPEALLESASAEFLIHLDALSIDLAGNLVAATIFSILLLRWSPKATT